MMTFGLALPHYEGLFSDPTVGDRECALNAVAIARRAEDVGFHQVWVSDHLWLELAPGDRRRSPDCWALLAAIAAATKRIRLGSLVTAAPLRDPALLAHQIATVAYLAPDRLDVGIGAGWNAQEFTTRGMGFPAASERLRAVEYSIRAIRDRLGNDTPPIWLGGKRRGIVSLAGRLADGWNLAWNPARNDYERGRHDLDEAAVRAGRSPSMISASIGLVTLVGTDENDLQRRWDELRAWVPGSYLDDIPMQIWRQRGLVGTPKEIRRKISVWAGLGVAQIVCAFGIPFGIFDNAQLGVFTSTVASLRRAT